jgi:DNA-binding CsgD family transcriptional regulator
MNLSNLRSREVALVADFFWDLYTPVSADEFGPHMIRVARQHLKDFRVCFDEMPLKPGGIYRNNTSHFNPCPLDRVAQILGQSPSVEYYMLDGREKVVMISDFTSQRTFERTDFYQEIFKPWGVRYQLAACMWTQSHLCGFTLHRDRPIDEEMRVVVAMLYPHIVRAFEAAQHRGEPGARLLGRQHQLKDLGLTPRECDVLVWIAEGKRDAEIAKILGISRRTVSKHVESLLQKLEAETRTAALARAAEKLRKHF